MNEKQNKKEIKNKALIPHELGLFGKFLPLWVAICIFIGIVLSQIVPGISETINSWSIGQISIPIGICLFFMMYPGMLNLQASELKKLGKNPKPIILTLISNWIVAPFVGLMMARIFLPGQEQLVVAIILLSASPCTAMVLVWGWMARGNQEQNVTNTSLNTITIIFLYVPIVVLLTGIQNIPIDTTLLIISLIFFIGLPLVALGIISKRLLTQSKGEDWFNGTYRPIVEKVSIAALLITLIILFSLNGDVLLKNPELLLLITIPLLVGFAIVVAYNVIITKLFKLKYKGYYNGIILGSSSYALNSLFRKIS